MPDNNEHRRDERGRQERERRMVNQVNCQRETAGSQDGSERNEPGRGHYNHKYNEGRQQR